MIVLSAASRYGSAKISWADREELFTFHLGPGEEREHIIDLPPRTWVNVEVESPFQFTRAFEGIRRLHKGHSDSARFATFKGGTVRLVFSYKVLAVGSEEIRVGSIIKLRPYGYVTVRGITENSYIVGLVDGRFKTVQKDRINGKNRN